jgi:hypothetical protein
MENVTKALLIAAGILFAVLILSLLAMFGGQLSGYYAEQHNSKIIEQDAKFNAQFENYNGQTIRGNEIISIMNKVVNYNTSIADMEKYDKVILSIDLKGYQNRANDNFKYSDSDTSIFQGKMSANILKNTATSDVNIRDVANISADLINELASAGISNISDAQLQALSADIQNIAIDSNAAQSLQITRNQKLQNILGKNKANSLNVSQMNTLVNVTKSYYQYTQFKRAMFKCTGVQHNTSQNGRVIGMTFVIVEENGKAKFD